MTELLYKYRSLDNFKNFVDILLNNRLYAAMYKDLNDPMEGQYYYRDIVLGREIREKLSNDKEKLRICSLSRINNNELMWSHYTNGQRGVAIGVSLDKSKYNVVPIVYDGPLLLQPEHLVNLTAIQILSHKMSDWFYEQEERVFTTDGSLFIDVKVEKVITGRAMSTQDLNLVRRIIRLINQDIEIVRAVDIMNH